MILCRLQALQQHDDEKRENEVAKNNLESHVFETRDAMYSDPIIAVSTEEQREVILTALREATDWLDDEGYTADTKVVTQHLHKYTHIRTCIQTHNKYKHHFMYMLSLSHAYAPTHTHTDLQEQTQGAKESLSCTL